MLGTSTVAEGSYTVWHFFRDIVLSADVLWFQTEDSRSQYQKGGVKTNLLNGELELEERSPKFSGVEGDEKTI